MTNAGSHSGGLQCCCKQFRLAGTGTLITANGTDGHTAELYPDLQRWSVESDSKLRRRESRTERDVLISNDPRDPVAA